MIMEWWDGGWLRVLAAAVLLQAGGGEERGTSLLFFCCRRESDLIDNILNVFYEPIVISLLISGAGVSPLSSLGDIPISVLFD